MNKFDDNIEKFSITLRKLLFYLRKKIDLNCIIGQFNAHFLFLVIIYQHLLFHLKMCFKLIIKNKNFIIFIIVYNKFDESVGRVRISGLNKLHLLITESQIGFPER